MNCYTIDNFKKLDRIFFNVLNSNYSTWRTYCISSLQFIKPHPEYFVKYKYFFSNNILTLLILILIQPFTVIFKLLKFAIRKIEDDVLRIFNYTNNNFQDKKTDIIFITSLVNSNTLSARKNSNHDFIFGNIIKHLRKKNKVKIIYLNLTKINSKKIFNFLKHNKEIYILNKILTLKGELIVLKDQITEFYNLLINLSIKRLGIKNYVLILANVFSYETRNNFRLRMQINYLVKLIKPSLVALSFEGNCWEKGVFNVCKNLEKNKKIKCKTVGYQHAGIMNLQTIINHRYKNFFNPDFVITSGKTNMKYFYKFFKTKKKIFEIGSNRHVQNINKKNKIKKLNKNILILPEGTYEETKILFDLSAQLAKNYPRKNFILRTHPQININSFSKRFLIFDKYTSLKNLIFSKKTFDEDLKRSDAVIYRGSTGIVTAILHGLIPIYFKQSGEKLNLDPIFNLKKFKKIISSIKDFGKALDNINYNDFNKAKIFSSNYFTPQKLSKTLNVFKKISDNN